MKHIENVSSNKLFCDVKNYVVTLTMVKNPYIENIRYSMIDTALTREKISTRY
jgi:hypothetical protein